MTSRGVVPRVNIVQNPPPRHPNEQQPPPKRPEELLIAFKSEQLEQMCEKLGDEPLSDKEVIKTMSGLAAYPIPIAQEKDIKDLSKEQLEDLNKAISAKRGKCFNSEIDSLLGKLSQTKVELIEQKRSYHEQQKLIQQQNKISFFSSEDLQNEKGQEEEKQEEAANKQIRDEIF